MTEKEKSYEYTIPSERLKKIVLYLESNHSADIRELAQIYNVSDATIRRDLDRLEKSGQIQRTHGGAVIRNFSTSFEHIYIDKAQIHEAQKKKIATYAASLISDGETVFLDSGTTTFQIAMQLEKKKNLTVVTYDLAIASCTKLDFTSILMVTGGIKRCDYNVLVGSDTESFISGLRVDKVFLSADAIDVDYGVSNSNFYETGIKKLLMSAGNSTIVVADSSKFGKKTVAKVTGFDRIDMVITDTDISENDVSSLVAQKVKVVCV